MNTPDTQTLDDKPRDSGVNAMLRIKLFVTGALFGATCLLFVVLMQWHMPNTLGWSVPWLPIKSSADSTIKVMAPVIVMAPADHADKIAPTTLTPPVLPSALPATAAHLTSAINMPESTLLIPVSGVISSQLTDTFKDARGAGRVHDAIDIMAPKGTPVFAVADGSIVKLFNSKQGGLTLYQFDTAKLHAYYYAHLDSYATGIIEGKSVHRGDLIGTVGSTGNASPEAPHLHFAIFVLGPEKKWWQGTAINPFPLLTNQLIH